MRSLNYYLAFSLLTLVGFVSANSQVNQTEIRALLPIQQNAKWGYIDSQGTVVIQGHYQQALSFSEGLAPVETEGKWGYIDQTDKLCIKPRFRIAGLFHDGLARVQINDKW